MVGSHQNVVAHSHRCRGAVFERLRSTVHFDTGHADAGNGALCIGENVGYNREDVVATLQCHISGHEFIAKCWGSSQSAIGGDFCAIVEAHVAHLVGAAECAGGNFQFINVERVLTAFGKHVERHEHLVFRTAVHCSLIACEAHALQFHVL